MNARTRLALCALIIAGSVGYGFLVATDSGRASAVALGYVCVILTISVLISFGKRRNERQR